MTKKQALMQGKQLCSSSAYIDFAHSGTSTLALRARLRCCLLLHHIRHKKKEEEKKYHLCRESNLHADPFRSKVHRLNRSATETARQYVQG